MLTRATAEESNARDASQAGKLRVNHVHVLEIEEDVIALVAPHYLARYGKRLTVVQADAFTWKPDLRFNFVWHDIWSAVCGDHYEDMKHLHRRWGKWTDAQDSWCRYEIKRAAVHVRGRY